MADSPRDPFQSRSQLPRFLATSVKKPNLKKPSVNSANETKNPKLASLEFQLENLKNDLKRKELEFEREQIELQRKLAEEHEQKNSLQLRLTLVEKQLEEQSTSYQKEIEEVRNEKEATQVKIHELLDAKWKEIAELKTQIEKNDQALSEKNHEVMVSNQALQMKDTNLTNLEKLFADSREQLETKCKELAAAEQQLQELSVHNQQLEESIKQVSSSIELEKINAEQRLQISELEKLKAAQEERIEKLSSNNRNVEILKEEKNDLESKLYRFEEYRDKVATLELENEKIQTELNSWKSLITNELPTPEAVSNKLVFLQNTNANLGERVSSLESQLSNKPANQPLGANEKDAAHITELETKLKELHEQNRRLQRQKSLATQEIDLLRENLKSYDDEEAILSEKNTDMKKLERIEGLVKLVDEYKLKLESMPVSLDVDETSDEVSLQKRRRKNEHKDAGYVTELYRKNQHLLFQVKEKTNIEAFLREQIITLESSIATLRQELAQVTEINSCRVLQHRSNPTLKYERIKAAQLEMLNAENSALKALLEDKKVDCLPIQSFKIAERKALDLKKEVAEREKRIQRLKEIFSVKSLEFREAVFSLFGYKLDFMPNGSVRVTSTYSREDNTAFIFDGESSTMKLVGNPSGPEFERLIRFWCDERKTIPGMLAALTLELLDKND
ncbi:mitotic spindle checkpoint protein Mad1 [Schizosaccharomyces pombe]